LHKESQRRRRVSQRKKEKPMPIVYKEVKLDHGYRIDLLVEEKMVLKG